MKKVGIGLDERKKQYLAWDRVLGRLMDSMIGSI